MLSFQPWRPVCHARLHTPADRHSSRELMDGGTGRQMDKGRGHRGSAKQRPNHKACHLEVLTLFVISCSLGERISSHALEDLSFQMAAPRADAILQLRTFKA